jgi:hypothetical protein
MSKNKSNVWAKAMKIIDSFNQMQDLIRNDFKNTSIPQGGGASEWQQANLLCDDIDAVKHHFIHSIIPHIKELK